MRTRAVFASTAVGVIASAGLAVDAAQAAHAASQLTVVEHAVNDTVVDVGTAGDSLGDLLTFANPVFNGSNSRRIGRDQGSCVRTVVGKAWQCSWTTWLPKGSLVVEGPFYDTRDSVLAITGGTGAYSRARGVMHLHARNTHGTRYGFKFTIQN